MFRSKTVFVLGAGSSNEVGLPVGDTLKNEIADNLDIGGGLSRPADPRILQAINEYLYQKYVDLNTGPYFSAIHKLREALPLAISIDNLLDAHRNDEFIQFCGKIGIVKSILEAESRSLIHLSPVPEKKLNFRGLPNTWFSGLIKVLTEGVPKEEVGALFNNVEFINFNYDRCLEHYLFNGLASYYALSTDEVIQVMKSAKIYRPYGRVGALPWENAELKVTFGSVEQRLLTPSKGIKTFFERVEEGDSLRQMRGALRESERVIFLGFAFHRQNMQLLGQEEGDAYKPRRVYATALGMSESDRLVVASELQEIFSGASVVDVRNTYTCAQLFSEYWRTLTAPLG